MTKRSICINPYIYSFSRIQWLYNPRKALDNRFYTMIQGTINWRASSNPDFILNYFFTKRMFDFFDNWDKCRKPGFLRGNIYTSCISMVLLDHFANKSNTFLSLYPSLALPFPPWVSTSSYPSYQDTAIKGTLVCSSPSNQQLSLSRRTATKGRAHIT